MAPRNKHLVARQFSRAAGSYDYAAGVQQRAVSQLLDGLSNVHGHWLDIGCGTGVALPHLREKGALKVTGVDFAEGMLAAATTHADSNTQLVLADADNLPLPEHSADGLLSSLMLQWSESPLTTLTEWCRVLRPGGKLAIATLLPGTQQELQSAWQAIDNRPHVNEFTPAEELLAALHQSGFSDIQYSQARLTEYYESLPDLLRGLKRIGATNVNPGRRSGLGGRNAIRELNTHFPTTERDGQLLYPLSYEVLWIYATAETSE